MKKFCLSAQHISLMCLLLLSNTCKADELYLAVSANFLSTIKTLQTLFESKSGHRFIISSASSGQLYSQIHFGAPYEVYLSADRLRPKMLIHEGLAVKHHRAIYARGQLALWSPEKNTFLSTDDELGERILKTDTLSRLVIANPKLAPYGDAAIQAMKHLKVYHLWKNRLITAQSTAQAQQFTLSGSVPFALIPLSQIKALPVEQQGSHWLIPKTYYAPIEQELVLLKKGVQNPAALAFLKFITSKHSQEIIRDAGYLTERSY